MLVYMDHPTHGTYIAYTPLEVNSAKVKGWVVREPVKEEAKRDTIKLKKADKCQSVPTQNFKQQ